MAEGGSKKTSSAKVFDVAKPGKGKMNIGSKPMIVGHKSLASDPMMRDENSVDKTEEPVPDKSVIQSSKVKIVPISDDIKASDDDKSANEKPSDDTISLDDTLEPNPLIEDHIMDSDESSADDKKEAKTLNESDEDTKDTGEDELSDSDNVTDEEENTEEDISTSDVSGDSGTEKTDQSSDKVAEEVESKKAKEIDPAAIEMERADNLNKIIESKKYRLEIKEVASPRSRKNILIGVSAILVGIITIYVLIDLNVLDLGIKLPVRIFGKEDVVQPIQNQTLQDTTVDETPAEQTKAENTPLIELSDSSKTFSFQYPSSWKLKEYKWEDCCEGPAKTEPDWTVVPQPISLLPDPTNISPQVDITAVKDGSMTLEDVKSTQIKDQFNTYEELEINGQKAYYNKLDFVGPSEAEKYLDHTYYIFDGDTTVKIYFRQSYSNTTVDSNPKFDGSEYFDEFENLVKSVKLN